MTTQKRLTHFWAVIRPSHEDTHIHHRWPYSLHGMMIVYYSVSGCGPSYRSSSLLPTCCTGWGGGGMADTAEAERWKGRQARHHLGVTSWKYIIISDFFLFHLSKNTSVWYQSSFRVCFSFGAHITEGATLQKKLKLSWMTGTLLPDGLISWFVFWHCFYIFALIAWHWFGRTCLHQVIC